MYVSDHLHLHPPVSGHICRIAHRECGPLISSTHRAVTKIIFATTRHISYPPLIRFTYNLGPGRGTPQDMTAIGGRDHLETDHPTGTMIGHLNTVMATVDGLLETREGMRRRFKPTETRFVTR